MLHFGSSFWISPCKCAVWDWHVQGRARPWVQSVQMSDDQSCYHSFISYFCMVYFKISLYFYFYPIHLWDPGLGNQDVQYWNDRAREASCQFLKCSHFYAFYQNGKFFKEYALSSCFHVPVFLVSMCMLLLQYVVALHGILEGTLNIPPLKCILQHKDMFLRNIRLLSLNATTTYSWIRNSVFNQQ